jgi:hypothetical protein
LFNKLFVNDPLWQKLLQFPQASAPFLPAKYSFKVLMNIFKFLRYIKDEFQYFFEIKYPNQFKSRWDIWRKVYKTAKFRETKFIYNQEYEDLLSSKSNYGKSRPIPNFGFVNFESLVVSIKENENPIHRSN